MPTRKEILEELGVSIDELSETLDESSSRTSFSAEQIEQAALDFGHSTEGLMRRLAEFSEILDDSSLRTSYSAEQIERAVAASGISAERLIGRLNEHSVSIENSSKAMVDASKRVETSIGKVSTEVTTGLVEGIAIGGALLALFGGMAFPQAASPHRTI